MASGIIVEDRSIHAHIIDILLDSRHTILDVIGTGERAIEAVRKSDPDFVLMDLNLKEGNGIEATEIIHSKFPEKPIIISTAHVTEELRSQASDAGAAEYLVKPYGKADLNKAITSALNR